MLLGGAPFYMIYIEEKNYSPLSLLSADIPSKLLVGIHQTCYTGLMSYVLAWK